jgi:nucleotide-binding universal stress UspA family protein
MATAQELHLRRVLCGVDQSPIAHHAARVARTLADAFGARLALVHAIPRAATGTDAVARDGERVLAAIGDELGVPLDARLLVAGDPARGLARAARETCADLLVIGTRGEGSVRAAFTGSVSAEVMAPAPCPVLAVGPGIDPAGSGIPGRCVVLAMGEAPDAEAGRTARGLADALGLRLVLVHVLRGATRRESLSGDGDVGPDDRHWLQSRARDALEQMRRTLAHGATGADGRDGELRLRAGPVADQVRELAREEDAAIVVVGSRGRGAVASGTLGSVSRDLVRRLDRPVVVCPPAP